MIHSMHDLEMIALDMFENDPEATARFVELTNEYIEKVGTLIAETLGFNPGEFVAELVKTIASEGLSDDASGS